MNVDDSKDGLPSGEGTGRAGRCFMQKLVKLEVCTEERCACKEAKSCTVTKGCFRVLCTSLGKHAPHSVVSHLPPSVEPSQKASKDSVPNATDRIPA